MVLEQHDRLVREVAELRAQVRALQGAAGLPANRGPPAGPDAAQLPSSMDLPPLSELDPLTSALDLLAGFGSPVRPVPGPAAAS